MKTQSAQTETTCTSLATQQSQSPSTRNFLDAGFRRFSAACLRKFNELKERVTAELTAEFGGALNSLAVRQSVNEANALAAATPFPALFLPVLAEEKVRAASQWSVRQRAIRNGRFALAA